MIFLKTLFALFLSGMATSADAFGVAVPPSQSSVAFSAMTSSSSRRHVPSNTCLFAEEEAGAASSSEEEVGVGEAADSSPEMDILSSPAFLKRKIEVLKSDIEATEKETEEAQARAEAGRAEWGPQLDSLRSEYKNIQDRMATQNDTRDMEVVRRVVREMLELLDNFDRAFGVVKPENDDQAKVEAEYKEAYQMVMDVIAGLGVEEVTTVGSEFDYELHQAVMQKPGTEYEEGIVCEEFQKGFKIGDSLIRPAMVAVAA